MQESPAGPPTGDFEMQRPAREKQAKSHEEESSDDRTRHASVRRLARLLSRLINLSGLNRTLCLSDENPEHSISDEFKTLAIAAQRVEIAPGIELGRALWTHAQALHSKRIYARFRELSRVWPPGHAPQGFPALFPQQFKGSTIHFPGGAPVV